MSFSLALQKTKERKYKSKQRMQNIIVTLQIEIRKKYVKSSPTSLIYLRYLAVKFWKSAIGLPENNIRALISNDHDGNEKRDDVKQYQSSKRFGPQASK